MCGCNCSPRLEGASETTHSVSRREVDVPMATFPVVDILGGHSFHCPTLSDDTGRDTERKLLDAQETRERLRAAD